MEEINKCPVCEEAKFNQYLSCMDYTVSRETFQIIQCNSCGFKFTNPRPSESEVSKYYESEEYISHSGTSKGIVNKLYRIVRNYTVKQKVNLANKLNRNAGSKRTIEKPPRNILDIGCGTGEFLNACKQNGWNVTGIEPSASARKNTKVNFGFDSYASLLDLPPTPDGGRNVYNIISMWHVLEHVHNLQDTISQIKQLLDAGGHLIVAVPNCNSWDAKKYNRHWAGYDVPRHLYHFTEKDIQTLFAKFSFTLKQSLPMKFDSYYVSLLSEKYKTGRVNLFAGFFNGFKSNSYAAMNKTGYSSQIYILANNK